MSDQRLQGSGSQSEPPEERIRWSWHQLTFKTPEEFEARRGESWFAKGRHHRTWEGGIEREERTDDATLGVGHGHIETLAELCIGRTIVAIDMDSTSEYEWDHAQNSVTITLDDGSVLGFSGWGHDASGLDTSYSPPKETP